MNQTFGAPSLRRLLAIALAAAGLLVSCAHAQDVLETPQGSVPVFRHTDGAAIVVDWATPVVDRPSWFSLGSQGLGRVTMEATTAGTTSTYVFPEIASLDVWLSVPVEAKTTRVRLFASRPWPESLTYHLSAQLDPRRSIAASEGSWTIRLPDWTAKGDWIAGLALSWESTTDTTISVVGPDRSRRFDIAAGEKTFRYYPEAWSVSPNSWIVRSSDLRWKSIALEPIAANQSIVADTASVLNWPPERWRARDREWFRWDARPNVLILVTKDYSVQDRYFKRLAFFVEKTGFQGKLATDAEMAGLHGWNAHDYSAASLSAFYNRAVEESFALNEHELETKQVLIAHKILLEESNGRTVPGDGAILGISQQSTTFLRSFLLTHEAFHGFYFTSVEYRDVCLDVWNRLSPEAKRAMRAFLASARYNPENEELMVNEFQAYCLQQPAAEWETFFYARVLRGTTLPPAEKRILVDQYVAAANALASYVERAFSVKSGDVTSVRPVP